MKSLLLKRTVQVSYLQRGFFTLLMSLILTSASQAQLEDTKIAYSSYQPGNSNTAEIVVMNPDGTDQTQLTNNGVSDTQPCWTPDGLKIVFVSDRDGNSEIYIMNADGSNPINLTKNPANDYSPCCSPDGSKIYFASTRDGDDGEIYVMNVDGSNPTRLTNNLAHDQEPCVSPAGTKVAFMSTRDGNWEIYVMNADGSNPIRLTNHPGSDGHPSWSPDGGKITFDSTRDGNSEIYVMNADGTNLVNLTNRSEEDVEPSWAPDGTKIVFRSGTNANAEIYTMNNDGFHQCRLTYNSLVDVAPSWSPFLSRAGTINGRVTDKGTGQSIAQAFVIALQKPARLKEKTGSDGFYEISGLSPGTWQVLCWKRGYKFTLKIVTLAPGETKTVDFMLERKAAGSPNDIPPEFRAVVNAAPAPSVQHKLTTKWGAIKRR